MGSKEEFLSKLIKSYNDLKSKELNNLESKKIQLKKRIEEETKKFTKLKSIKEKLEEENKEADYFLYSLIEILRARGILFDIKNKNFNVNEWDNLYIQRINGVYCFVTKTKELIVSFDKKYSEVMEYILKNHSYSVVIIRKNSRFLKAQFRVLE